MSDPIPEQFLECVRKSLEKGGYPLEWEVDTAFREAGFQIRRGFHFLDVNQEGVDTRRETDVVAVYNGGTARMLPGNENWSPIDVEIELHVPIECKHSPEKAWVALTASWHCFPDPDRLVLPAANSLGHYVLNALIPNKHAIDLPALEVPARAAFQLTTAPKNNPKDTDMTEPALHQVTKAACSLMHGRLSGSFVPNCCRIAFPAIVFDNYLLENWKDDREGTVKLEEVETSRVYWHGSTETPDYISVDIVRQTAVRDYAKRLFQSCERLSQLIHEHLPTWAARDLTDRQPGQVDLKRAALEKPARQAAWEHWLIRNDKDAWMNTPIEMRGP